MRISEALGGRLPLAVQFPSGAVLNIEYHPASYTVAELEALQKSERDPMRIIEAIRRIVVSWDLTDDEGRLVPVDPPFAGVAKATDPESGEVTVSQPMEDPLRHIPTPVFTQIIKAVNEDQTAGK